MADSAQRAVVDDLLDRILNHAWSMYDYCVEHRIPSTPPFYPRDFTTLSDHERKRITAASRRATQHSTTTQ